MSSPEPFIRDHEAQATILGEYVVAVRTLCEFAAKTGDLDLRFTPSPSAQAGIAGHAVVQNRRAASYRKELPVHGNYKTLRLRGRADGFDPEQRLLEEIKTCIGSADDIPENQRRLHWAQAKIYAALLCREYRLAEMDVAVVYFDIRDQRELPPRVLRFCAAALEGFLAELCEPFLVWAEREAAHRKERDRALERLAFPHSRFRPGQRDLAKAVFNAARGGRCLLAQAPTGIGKTLATLFPMLKACPRAALDRVFFLTAKGPGKAIAFDAVRTLHERHPELALRTLELTARDKACEHPDKACHGESCALARGFYDRLPAARLQAAKHRLLTRDAVREIALAHKVCPYYLAQEMTRWCDLVVADYNHYFDRSALLYALVVENEWRVGLLVDEAHNLVDRARAMYTAALSSRRLPSAGAPVPPEVATASGRLRRQWRKLGRDAGASYAELDGPTRPLRTSVHDLTAALSEHFARSPTAGDAELLDSYFDALAFERALDDYADHSMLDVRMEPAPTGNARRADTTITVRNVVPASFLAPRFDAASCCVLFSATLAPWRFYTDMLGLPAATDHIDIPTPFDPDQLRVCIVDGVSTRYRERERSIDPIVQCVELQYRRRPGNHLVFLSSHEYLERIADRFSLLYPHIPCWRQARHMSDVDRTAFLEAFVSDGAGIGFAVLGGVFAEGIDLVGTRLVGAFIATLGLPQANEINEAMRRRLDRRFGPGYDYTYLYPGLRKVVQAAGRVIRTESDRGCLYLIDDRYARPDVRKLLPPWWRVEIEPAQ